MAQGDVVELQQEGWGWKQSGKEERRFRSEDESKETPCLRGR